MNGTRLPGATRADQKSSFTADELCLIVDTCVRRGVKSLRVGDLFLEFQSASPVDTSQIPQVMSLGNERALDLTDKEHEELRRAHLESEEVRLKEERVAQMILEDPIGFERMLENGELEEMIEDGSSDEGADDSAA